jgi:hypothetical protein
LADGKVLVVPQCRVNRNLFKCHVPFETKSDLTLHKISASVNGVLSEKVGDACKKLRHIKSASSKRDKKRAKKRFQKGNKIKEPDMPLIAVAEKGGCSVGMKAANAHKAGYDALLVVGGRDYDVRKLEELVRLGAPRTDDMVFDEAQAYPLPVVVVDKEEYERSMYKGAQVSIFMQAVKVDGRTQIKDAAMITIEGHALLQQNRFDEAAARLYIANLLDPRLVHLQYLLLMAQFLRDCAPKTKSSFVPPSAYSAYHKMTTSTPASRIRAHATEVDNSEKEADEESTKAADEFGYSIARDEGMLLVWHDSTTSYLPSFLLLTLYFAGCLRRIQLQSARCTDIAAIPPSVGLSQDPAGRSRGYRYPRRPPSFALGGCGH